MAEYDNEGSGALFKNNKKTTEKHPDYTGEITIGGTAFWLSAWVKTSKSGMQYLSVSKGQAKDAKGGKPAKKEEEVAFDL